jgi:hypothetical protein
VPVRRRSLFAAILLTLSLGLGFVASPFASADSTSNAQFVSDTNSARSQHGLRAYVVSSDLTSIANRWAAHMAANRTLEHNPYASSEVCCWQAMGENVGEGSSVSQIQQAFMSSAPHRDNILSSSYTQVGIGTARSSDGQLWVDELFRQPSGAAAPRASVPTTRTYYRPASRSAYRAPLRAVRAAPRHPSAARRAPAAVPLTSAFLREVRQELPGRVRFDPVGGAFGYLQVMVKIIR